MCDVPMRTTLVDHAPRACRRPGPRPGHSRRRDRLQRDPFAAVGPTTMRPAVRLADLNSRNLATKPGNMILRSRLASLVLPLVGLVGCSSTTIVTASPDAGADAAGTAGTGGSSGTGGAAGADSSAGTGGVAGIDGSAGNGGSAGTEAGAGSGGAAGTDGGAGADGGVGAGIGHSCQSDAECASGLTCATASSALMAGEGPANGYCTKECTADGDCQAVSSGALCAPFGAKSYCLQGCTVGGATSVIDPSKCFGRMESACAHVDVGKTACTPTCNTDADCGAGLFCDYRTGRCLTVKRTGLPVGSACDPTASSDPCAGVCGGTGSSDPTKGRCTGFCTVGSISQLGVCGSSPTPGVPQDAACLVVSDPNGGIGDLGYCGQLCNCDNDCGSPDFVCIKLGNSTLESFLGKTGFCDLPTSGTGTPCP